VIGHVADLVLQEGSNVWFIREAKDLAPEGTVCPLCGSEELSKESDIIDVWFESGVSNQAVLKGIECILKCQIVVDGKKQAWCAQHDEKNFAPADARTYEKASLSGSESVGIVDFLMQIENPSIGSHTRIDHHDENAAGREITIIL